MEITKHVHLLEAMKGSYVYLILEEEPVLIDTGLKSKFASLERSLQALGMRFEDIAHIIVTHQDVDHIGNAKALKAASKATLWSSVEDKPYIQGERKGTGVRKMIQTLIKVDHPTIDQTFAPGQRIGDLEVIPSPGHTPGHVCLLYHDVLLAGDLVKTSRGKVSPSPNFLASDKEALRRSIREVAKLSFDYICPAHGEPVRGHSFFDMML